VSVTKYKTKAGMRYRAEFEFQGERYPQGGFLKKSDAQSWIAEGRKRLAEVAKNGEVTDLLTQVVTSAYLDYCEARLRPTTTAQKDFVFDQLMEFMGGNVPIKEITDSKITEFLKRSRQRATEKGNDPNKTANRDLREINALFNWALRQKEFANKVFINPCRYIQSFPEEEAVRYVPPAEDVQKVLLAATPWETDILTVLLHTGARIGEIRNLLWDDLSMERKELRLWTRKRKGGAREYRTLTMGPTLEAMFARLWKDRDRDRQSPFVFTNPETGTGWSKHSWPMKFFMARICERAGVRRMEFHALRHYVARMVRDSKKATPFELQKFLGHQRLQTTEIYLRDLGSSTGGVSQILEDLTQNPTPGSHTEAIEK